MSNLKRRIERVEQQILGEDDEIITIDWLSGPPFQMTMGEFRQMLRDAEGRGTTPECPSMAICRLTEERLNSHDDGI